MIDLSEIFSTPPSVPEHLQESVEKATVHLRKRRKEELDKLHLLPAPMKSMILNAKDHIVKLAEFNLPGTCKRTALLIVFKDADDESSGFVIMRAQFIGVKVVDDSAWATGNIETALAHYKEVCEEIRTLHEQENGDDNNT